MDKNMSDEPQFAEAELARVADGSLEAAHEAEVRRRLEGSPELSAALGEQERAMAMLRSIDVKAPESLHAVLDEQRRHAVRKPRRRLRFGLGYALPATVAVAVALAIVLMTSGGSSGPSLQQTVRLTLASATYPAPSERNASTLDATAAGIPFPYWQQTVGWRAVGARVDRVGGREIQTVFYGSRHGRRVGYAIVGGPAVPVGHGRTVTVGGVPYHFLNQGSATLVTWLRAGHTCVIAGRGVSEAMLLRLATADARA
jgi:anti-sigma factor RsiW